MRCISPSLPHLQRQPDGPHASFAKVAPRGDDSKAPERPGSSSTARIPNTYAELQDSTGTVQSSNNDGKYKALRPHEKFHEGAQDTLETAALIRRQLDAGSYYIMVRGNGGGDTGKYTLYVRVGDVPDAMFRNGTEVAVSVSSWGAPTAGGLYKPPAGYEAAVVRGVTEGFDGKGTVYVWASGNNARDETSDANGYPTSWRFEHANFDGGLNHYTSVAVCAVDYFDQVPWYSELGANLWVCGPGGGGRLLDEDFLAPEVMTTTMANRYATITGTSAAAPMVGGGVDAGAVVALADGWTLLPEFKNVEVESDKLNRSPRGIWSDGVTIWVSDDGAKRLFAYRVEAGVLVRYEVEEFTFRSLLKAGNGSPRGIWSDGDIMYVVDDQDDKVYTYNIPDAIIALLSSLTLSDIEIGDFSPGRLTYITLADTGATVTTVEAIATQAAATVVITPSDADGDPENGHQANLEAERAISITVTSEDGSRTTTHRVLVSKAACLDGLANERLSEVTFVGGSLDDLGHCARELGVVAFFYWTGESWLLYAPDAPEYLSRQFRSNFEAGIPVGASFIAATTGDGRTDN